MVWILLLLGLTSVCGLSLFKTRLFEAEEGDNITIRVNSPKEMDLSLLNINCVFKTNPVKLLIGMLGGVEDTEYQDEQFSGRVELNREALKQGQVQIHVTGLGPQDSGEYECHMAANYNRDKGEWDFTSTMLFEINVGSVKSGTKVTTKQQTTTKPRAVNGENVPEKTPALGKPRMKTASFIVGCVISGIIVMFDIYLLGTCIVTTWSTNSSILSSESRTLQHPPENTSPHPQRPPLTPPHPAYSVQTPHLRSIFAP